MRSKGEFLLAMAGLGGAILRALSLVMLDLIVVLVNYGQASLTAACLKALRPRQAAPSGLTYRVVLVENGSGQGAQLRAIIDRLGTDGPAVDLLVLPQNLGFAGGNMAGLDTAPKSRYVLFLNNDTEAGEGLIDTLVAFMDGHPQAGLAGGLMLDMEGRLQTSWGYLPTLTFKLGGHKAVHRRDPARNPPRHPPLTVPRPVPMVSGACLMVDRAMLVSLGGLDRLLFLYCEEEDLAARVWAAGREVWHVPAATYRHHIGGSTGRSPVMAAALLREYYISLLHYHRRHTPGAWRRAVLCLIYVVKAARRGIVRRPGYGGLAGFIARGAPASASLRYGIRSSTRRSR